MTPDAQAVGEPESSEQTKLVPSGDENVKAAVVAFVGFAGPVRRLVSGGVRSMVHVCDAGEVSTLPAGSTASTEKV